MTDTNRNRNANARSTEAAEVEVDTTAETLTVKSAVVKTKAEVDQTRVVLWERDAAHPGGEVFITQNGRSIEVGNTAAVQAALREGTLVKG